MIINVSERPAARWVALSRNSAPLSMLASFIVALALVVAVFAFVRTADRYGIALRVTARWSFLLFWLAYTGDAMARIFGPRFTGLAHRRRHLGLAYGSAQVVHVALIVRLSYIVTEPFGAMLFFWAGIVCTYLLALFSVPQLRDALGRRIWRASLTVATEYIALVFATDFILLPLQAKGIGQYPLSYLPFAFMLVGGALMRVVATAQDRLSAKPKGER